MSNTFYDWNKVTECPECSTQIGKDNEFKICDNDCGSFTCNGCKKEFYAQYIKNEVVINPGHYPKCGVYSDIEDY